MEKHWIRMRGGCWERYMGLRETKQRTKRQNCRKKRFTFIPHQILIGESN